MISRIVTLLIFCLFPMTASAQLMMKDRDPVELDGWSRPSVEVICTIDTGREEGQDMILAGIEDIVIADPDDLVIVLGEDGEPLFVGQGRGYYRALRANGAEGYRLSYLAQSFSEWAQAEGELYGLLGDIYWNATEIEPQGPQGTPRRFKGRLLFCGSARGNHILTLTNGTKTIQVHVGYSLLPVNATLINGQGFTVDYSLRQNGEYHASSIRRHP